jgi:hypothetical protein
MGGALDIRSSGLTALDGELTVAGGFTGGNIGVASGGELVVTGTLNANGSGQSGARAGQVAVEACGVRVDPGATLTAEGDSGLNRVLSRNGTVINGNMLADPLSGRNELVYRAEIPEILPSARIVPEAVQILDPLLESCSVCGNGAVESPETCDDGGRCEGGPDDGELCVVPDDCDGGVCTPVDGDGCSTMCRIEGAVTGDTNCDGQVNASDIPSLVSEIYDGDGDSVGMVGLGAYPGCAGADANRDEQVTGADITATLFLLR